MSILNYHNSKHVIVECCVRVKLKLETNTFFVGFSESVQTKLTYAS